jgi:heme/copper-type cytochrome/quinol oxidase subunit 2
LNQYLASIPYYVATPIAWTVIVAMIVAILAALGWVYSKIPGGKK